MTEGQKADLYLAAAKRIYREVGPTDTALARAMDAALLYERIGEHTRMQAALELAASLETRLTAH